MNEIRFFLGAAPQTPLGEALVRSSALPAWKPFDARAVAFVSSLSRQLLTHPRIRAFPELAALGHWFRATHLKEWAASLPVLRDAVQIGRGLVFHLAPANVDSVAMYSWLISLLAGNSNWVRVSQKSSPQFDVLLETLRQTLANGAGQDVAGRIVLLTYPHDDAISGAISAAAMCRVVWGGDATVAALRSIPLRPTAHEICFPDRFSAAVLRAASLLALDEPALSRLAASFYNDAFWFAQQACSSPRLLWWVGGAADCAQAQQRFWAAVAQELARRQPENTPAMNMGRLATAFDLAAAALAHPRSGQSLGQFPLRLQTEQPLRTAMRELHCGNGLFLEQPVESLSALAPQLSDKEQTLSVFGFSRQELLDFVDLLPPRAVDRLVPLGEALAFAPTWDGTDLLSVFTRRISLPPESGGRIR